MISCRCARPSSTDEESTDTTQCTDGVEPRTGTAVDESLGDAANTPHNGYIALAVRYGFPVALLYVFFGFGAFANGLRTFRKTRLTRLRLFAITLASPMIGILAHNMIESTITAASKVLANL